MSHTYIHSTRDGTVIITDGRVIYANNHLALTKNSCRPTYLTASNYPIYRYIHSILTADYAVILSSLHKKNNSRYPALFCQPNFCFPTSLAWESRHVTYLGIEQQVYCNGLDLLAGSSFIVIWVRKYLAYKNTPLPLIRVGTRSTSGLEYGFYLGRFWQIFFIEHEATRFFFFSFFFPGHSKHVSYLIDAVSVHTSFLYQRFLFRVSGGFTKTVDCMYNCRFFFLWLTRLLHVLCMDILTANLS